MCTYRVFFFMNTRCYNNITLINHRFLFISTEFITNCILTYYPYRYKRVELRVSYLLIAFMTLRVSIQFKCSHLKITAFINK